MIFPLQIAVIQGDKLTVVTNLIGGKYINKNSHLLRKIQFGMTNWMTNWTCWKFINYYRTLSDFPVCHTIPSLYGRECPRWLTLIPCGKGVSFTSHLSISKRGEICRIIPALDLGSTTGCALSQKSNSVVSRTQSFKTGRFEGGGMHYLRFQAWLQDIQSLAGKIDAACLHEVAGIGDV